MSGGWQLVGGTGPVEAVERLSTDSGVGTGGGGDNERRLNASATTFRRPGVWRISVENSDMYASCRTCLADQSGDTLLMASVRGRWSVRMRNWRPSNTNRKWRIAAKTASNSLSKVEYFDSGGDSFRLKKASGLHDPADSCCRTPPICVSDASVTSEMTAPGRGWTSTVAAARAALAAPKAVSALSDQTSVFGLPRRRSVSGWRVPAIPGRNLR